MVNFFATHVDYSIGSNPWGVAIADVNSDNRSDIVSADFGINKVSILLNQGDGTFAAHVDYTTGSSPVGVAIADVNSDNRPDVISANFGSTISVLLNQGSGIFGTKTDYALGGQAVGIAVYDLNSDNKPDVVTANGGVGSGTTISVLLNQGSGTFASHVEYSAGSGSNPQGVAIADVNGDGKPDIVSANLSANSVSVFLNQGSGTFATHVDYSTGSSSNPHGLDLADVNGDGAVDIVSANNGVDTVSVLLNQGSGTFSARTDYATASGTYEVVISDINGDGKLDIVSLNTNTVSVLLNQGSGIFGAKTDYAVGSGPRGVAAGDVNNDGKSDVVSANYSGSTISVLLNALCSAGTYSATGSFPCTTPANGGFTNTRIGATAYTSCPASTYNGAVGYGNCTSAASCVPTACTVGINGGFTNTQTGATTYTQCAAGYYNAGVGYGASSSVVTACTPCSASNIAATSGSTACTPCLTNQYTVNHITCQTFTVQFPTTFSTSLLNGTNGFQVQKTTGGWFGFSAASAGDFNGDGVADAIIGGANIDSISIVYGNRNVSNVIYSADYPSNGLNIFGRIGFGYDIGSAGDFNGDGITDIIIGDIFYNTAYVIFGNHSAFPNTIDLIIANSRGVKLTSSSNSFGKSVASAGDFNGDNIGDVIVGTNSAGAAYIIYGNRTISSTINVDSMLVGSNGFKLTSTTCSTVCGFGWQVASAGDFNADGISDIVVGNFPGNSLYVIYGSRSIFTNPFIVDNTLNTANGLKITSVTTSTSFMVGYAIAGGGDFNGDSITDIIAGDPIMKAAYIIYGGNSTLSASYDIESLCSTNRGIKFTSTNTEFGINVASAGDLNLDGIGDILIGSSGLAYVIYGNRTSLQNPFAVDSLLNGTNGFKIVNTNCVDCTVAGAGDVNGDSVPDILIGAGGYSRDSGNAYFIYG